MPVNETTFFKITKFNCKKDIVNFMQKVEITTNEKNELVLEICEYKKMPCLRENKLKRRLLEKHLS